jgi:hypothetical protein
MAGVSAQGATFTFRGIQAIVSGVSVETPTAEVTDMASAVDPVGTLGIVPTGEWSGGSISVDYLHAGPLQADPQTLVRQTGQLRFISPGYSVVRNVILESATTEATVGNIVRGTMRFRMTDYYGS